MDSKYHTLEARLYSEIRKVQSETSNKYIELLRDMSNMHSDIMERMAKDKSEAAEFRLALYKRIEELHLKQLDSQTKLYKMILVALILWMVCKAWGLNIL